MATYTHFGKQADVFKHLVLCEILQIEKPLMYVETNSASAIYQMSHTVEQQYGIYHFLEKANKEKFLRNSIYYRLESIETGKGNYLGSPALAMNILEKQASQYIFFDIEKDALENIELYARQIELETHIQTYHTDSLEGVIKLLPTLPKSSFLHIDPYEIDKKGISGISYLDILIKATQAGIKCLLWYGFMTEDDKMYINQYIINRLKEEDIKEYTCVELIMNSIRKDTIICNPGILGSGILTTNLSQESNATILEYSNMLVCTYSNIKYKNYDGELYRDRIK
ncbi:hypothetical protein [Bacteroides sp. MSB163]|uniref:hypothetical protein n=1 Tax=Bacteroides maternus TaxID=3117552 RepID=UPI00260B77D2|nr:hypothetical protein [uncultured Bacteroides sp.]